MGKGIRRSSRTVHPPRRPKEGWSLVVKSLGGKDAPGQPPEAYVAMPDGGRRELNEDERLYLERQTPRPRRKEK